MYPGEANPWFLFTGHCPAIRGSCSRLQGCGQYDPCRGLRFRHPAIAVRRVLKVELVKKNIHMNKIQCRSTLQLTLDDDFNVPDMKPDIIRVITEQGQIKIEDRKMVNGKLMVKGVLSFLLLYLSDEPARPVNSLTGDIPFDEVINIEGGCNVENASLKWEIEDLSAGIINSRKISVRSIVRFNAAVEELHDEEAAVAVDDGDDAECLHKRIRVTGLAVDKKDSYRLKEEITLPSNKGSMSEILYSEVELKNADARLLTDKFTIKGEVSVFFLYRSGDEENPMEYYETELPFSASIDCGGCDEDMIEDIGVSISGKNLEIKPDSDGEERMIDAEIIFDMDIKIYQEEDLDILSDIYSPVQDITPVRQTAGYENLLVKNNTKARITDRVRVGTGNPKVLQICHGSGTVKIDEAEIVKEGIQTDGVIEVELLYISAEDARPLQAIKSAIPFSQLIEVKGIGPDSIFDIKPGIEQIGVMMLDAEEIEIKASLHLNAIVFEPVSEPMITDLEIRELDMERLQAMPGMIGYVVKEGDTLWNIAKQYFTTMDTIRDINSLENDTIHPGDRLLMIKKVDSVFG